VRGFTRAHPSEAVPSFRDGKKVRKLGLIRNFLPKSPAKASEATLFRNDFLRIVTLMGRNHPIGRRFVTMLRNDARAAHSMEKPLAT
jgi:hypothetical protein